MNIIARVKRKIYKISHPVIGEVWMLHRVTNNQSRIIANRNMEISPDFLESIIIDYRNRGYDFVSMDSVIAILEGREKLRHFVAVTFDDGYRDNFEVAYPILKKLNVPFAIYVSTDFLDKKVNLWWYVLEDMGVDEQTFTKWHWKLIKQSSQDIQKVMSDSFSGYESYLVKRLEDLTISPEQLCSMASDTLCTIGSHGVSHTNLSAMNYDEQKKELEESKRRLETLLQKPIQHISYPFGAHNEDSIHIVRELGYCSATCAWGGAVRSGNNCFEIPRVKLKEKK